MPRVHPPILERFWNKVDKDRNGCWNWIGCKNNWGYPIFYENGKVLLSEQGPPPSAQDEPRQGQRDSEAHRRRRG